MLPKVNEVLFLQINSMDEEELKERYKSRIADVQGGQLMIEVPINVQTGKLKRLRVGDELSAQYYTGEGTNNFFNTYVIGFIDGEFRFVVLKKPKLNEIAKVQRRNYLRVPSTLEVSVTLNDKLRFVTLTNDIGGGGISFVCENDIPLSNQSTISCWLILPFKNGVIEHVNFNADVVRFKPLQNGTQQVVMCHFTDITDWGRQRIIRFCFERQLEFRKE